MPILLCKKQFLSLSVSNLSISATEMVMLWQKGEQERPSWNF